MNVNIQFGYVDTTTAGLSRSEIEARDQKLA